MDLRFNGLTFMFDSCQWNEIPDQVESWSFSTLRGYLGFDAGVSISGGFSSISQIGYFSPTKGIACGNYVPLGV